MLNSPAAIPVSLQEIVRYNNSETSSQGIHTVCTGFPLFSHDQIPYLFLTFSQPNYPISRPVFAQTRPFFTRTRPLFMQTRPFFTRTQFYSQ